MSPLRLGVVEHVHSVAALACSVAVNAAFQQCCVDVSIVVVLRSRVRFGPSCWLASVLVFISLRS